MYYIHMDIIATEEATVDDINDNANNCMIMLSPLQTTDTGRYNPQSSTSLAPGGVNS